MRCKVKQIIWRFPNRKLEICVSSLIFILWGLFQTATAREDRRLR